MMSDKETLMAMLTKANIAFADDSEADEDAHSEDIDGSLTGKRVYVERGYPGFVTVFVFNKDGTLKDMGAYE